MEMCVILLNLHMNSFVNENMRAYNKKHRCVDLQYQTFVQFIVPVSTSNKYIWQFETPLVYSLFY